jgi:hypothetical protein
LHMGIDEYTRKEVVQLTPICTIHKTDVYDFIFVSHKT